jgi:hypothetical protein
LSYGATALLAITANADVIAVIINNQAVFVHKYRAITPIFFELWRDIYRSRVPGENRLPFGNFESRSPNLGANLV